MCKPKYEIEFQFIGHFEVRQSIFCSLTGLSWQEVDKVVNKDRMTGSEHVKAFNQLGFNTNKRFIKFDPKTYYPAVLRCAGKGCWYAFVYSNGMVFDPYNNLAFSINDKKRVKRIKNSYYLTDYNLKITSMLQVWI